MAWTRFGFRFQRFISLILNYCTMSCLQCDAVGIVQCNPSYFTRKWQTAWHSFGFGVQNAAYVIAVVAYAHILLLLLLPMTWHDIIYRRKRKYPPKLLQDLMHFNSDSAIIIIMLRFSSYYYETPEFWLKLNWIEAHLMPIQLPAAVFVYLIKQTSLSEARW